MEVSDAGQCHINQSLQELIHSVGTQSNFAADRHFFTQLKRSNRFAGFGNNRFLTGNQSHFIYGIVKFFLVCHGFTDAHVQNNFSQLRNLVWVLVTEFFHQRLLYDFVIQFFKVCHKISPISSRLLHRIYERNGLFFRFLLCNQFCWPCPI